VRETLDLTIHSFNLTERYRIPVVLLLDEIVGHISEKISLPSPDEFEVYDRVAPSVPADQYLPYQHTESDIPEMATFGSGYRFHVTGLCHDETGFPTNDSIEIDKMLRRINRKMDRYRDDFVSTESFMLDDAEIGLFAYGSVARSARRAMALARDKGIKVGLLRTKTIWPFPDKEVRALGDQVRTIVVPELNLGQMAHEVEWAVAGNAAVAKVNRIDGEPISPLQILDMIEEVVKQ
jgi:2-oxoglutarate ferredoxin oxidoreductase subunit alpha